VFAFLRAQFLVTFFAAILVVGNNVALPDPSLHSVHMQAVNKRSEEVYPFMADISAPLEHSSLCQTGAAPFC